MAQELEEYKQRYLALFEQTGDAILLLTLEGVNIAANQRAADLLGYSVDELIGTSFQQIVARQEQGRAWQVLEALKAGRDVPTYERILRKKSGVEFPVEVHIALVRDNNGEPLYIQSVFRDISRRKAYEEALRESEERYRSVIASLAEGVVMVGSDGTIQAANSSAKRILDCSLDQLIGRSSLDLCGPTIAEDGTVFPDEAQPMAVTLQTGTPQQDVVMGVHRQSGGLVWISMNTQPLVRPGETRPYAVVASFTDITARKLAEAALLDSERRYREIVENASDSVCRVDREGRFVYANPAAAKLTGYPVSELLTLTLSDLVAPGWQEPVRQFYEMQIAAGPAETLLEFPIVTRAGEERWIEQRAALLEENGQIIGLQSIVRDITARRRAELAEREQYLLAEALHANAVAITSSLDLDVVLDRLLENIEPVVPHDMANIMLVGQEGIARIVRHRGYTERGSGDRIAHITVQIADIPTFRQMTASHRPLIVPDTETYPHWRPISGTEGIRCYMGAPIVFEGRVLGFLNLDSCVADSFTPTHAERLQAFANQAAIAVRNAQLFQEAQQHAAALEVRNAELDAFSHMVAHDLKAPLQVIIGYANLLKALLADDASPDLKEVALTIPTFAFKMNQIIDSMLLLAGLRDAEVKLGGVDVQPVVNAALARFRDQIRERQVEVVIAPDLPPALGYGPWLEEVFANLIGNAIKYIGQDNPAPRVVIRGQRLNGAVRYEVEDNGLGIKPEDQARLFRVHSRFHHGEAKGHGLGLSIVERIVTKLNGTAGVVSAPGAGSTFWFTLPAWAESAPE